MRIIRLASAFTLVLAMAAIAHGDDQSALRGQVVEATESDKQGWWPFWPSSGGSGAAPAASGPENGLQGRAFLDQLRVIIGADPKITPAQVQGKPFMGSFSTVRGDDDPKLADVKYCITDTSCGRVDAYTRTDVPLIELAPCNKFCYIDKNTKTLKASSQVSPWNPPANFICCTWHDC